MRTLILFWALWLTVAANSQTIYTVTKTTDPDPFEYPYNYVDSLCDTIMYGTLQWAIRKANDTPDSVLIQFNIPDSGPDTIKLNYSLPNIVNQVTIDGTTQQGYETNNPAIIIGGNFVIHANNCVIRGLYIHQDVYNGILCFNADNTIIENNVINQINHMTMILMQAEGAVALYSSQHCTVRNNILGTDKDNNHCNYPQMTSSCVNGVNIVTYPSTGTKAKQSNYNVIENNTIANCSNAGIYIQQGCTSDKLSQNLIYNCYHAIRLLQGANYNKIPPVITSYQNNTISGASAPNDIIEVFGSTGNENANEYLTTTIADSTGSWAAQATTTYPNVIATARDANNNTSGLTEAYQKQQIDTSCFSSIFYGQLGQNMLVETLYSTVWLKFRAVSDSMVVLKSDSIGIVNFISFYSGQCPNLNLLKTEINTQFIELNGLTIGEYYYLKLVGNNFKTMLLITTAISCLHNNVWDLNTDCPPLPCHLVNNNEFSVFCNSSINNPNLNYLSSNPNFSNNMVCGWQTAWGTPQLNVNTSNNIDNYLYMWNEYNWNANPHYFWGEGVYTNVYLIAGQNYTLNMVYKTGNNTIQRINIQFTNQSGLFTSFISPGQQMPPFNYQAEVHFYNKLEPNWTSIPPTIFQVPNTGLYKMVIFPYQDVVPAPQWNYHHIELMVQSIDITPVNPLQVSITGNTNTVFCGQSVNLTAHIVSGGTPPFTYVWTGGGSNSTTNTVQPTQTTTYYVTVTDAIGCTAVASHTVNVILPTPTFTYTGLCQAEPFIFTATPNNSGYTYNWDIDANGTPDGTGSTFSYTFNQPGYHPVKLTISACGLSSYTTQYVYVAPQDDNESINTGCCVNDIDWFPQPDNTYNYLYYDVYLANSVINWNYGPTHIIRVKNTLHILTGQTLNISNGTIVSFGPQGKIDIAPGGTLNVSGYAMLTGTCISPYTKGQLSPPQCECKNMWEGIQVRGTNGTPHFPYTQQNLSHTGRIIINGATIQDAHIAILVGIPNPPNTCTLGNPFSTTGKNGYIDVSNCNFVSDGIDIKFLDYVPPSIIFSSLSKYNYSKISNCDFSSIFVNSNIYVGPLKNNGYNTGSTYPYPNQFNPYYGYANTLGRTTRGIDLLQQKFIYALNSNTFNNVENGINSTNAAYTVSNSKFSNVARGVYINNQNTSLFYATHIITGNTFLTASNHAIEIQGGLNDYIKGNTFGDHTFITPQTANPYSIFLNSSSNFTINDNAFYMVGTAISLYGNSSGSNFIGYENVGNTFTGTTLNLFGFGDNSALQTKCNNSYNNITTANYIVNWYMIGPMADQGYPIIPGGTFNQNTKRPAGNYFNPPNTPSNEIACDVNTSFTYHEHDFPSNRQVSNTNNPLQIHIAMEHVHFDVANPANSCLSSTSGYSTVALLPLYQNGLTTIQQLKSQYANLVAQVDKGQTNYLLSNINTMAGGKLKDVLLSHSPLSDTVIVAAVNRTNPLAPGLLKEVLLANCPVSNAVWSNIYTTVSNLPNGIATQIKTAQGSNPTVTTLTSIQRQIDAQTNITKQIVKDIENNYIASDSINQALNFLKTVPFTDAAMTVTSSLADDSLTLTEAQSRLQAFQPANEAEQDWKTMEGIYMNLKQSGKSLFDIDSVQLSEVWQIALKNDYSLAIANARSYLYLLYGIEFPLNMNFSLNMNKRGEIKETTEVSTIYNIYPNPSLGIMEISTTGTFTGSETVSLTDVLGKTVYKELIPEGNNIHKISLSLPNGIYLCRIYNENEPVFEKTMVIQK